MKSESSFNLLSMAVEAFIWFIWPGWLVFIVVALLIFILATGIDKYRQSIVLCPKCGKQKRKYSIQTREELGYEDGWHSETRTVETKSDNYSSSNQPIGTSYSTTEVTTEVPHRTVWWREHYKCPECSEKWSLDYNQRFNL